MTPPKAKKTSGRATPKKSAKKATTKATTKRRSTVPPQTQGLGELTEPGTVGTALITRDSFTDLPVQFTVREGTAFFEGDIILGTVEELSASTEASRQGAKDVTRGLHRGVKPGSPVSNVDVAQDGPQSAVIKLVTSAMMISFPSAGRCPSEVLD